MKSALALFEKCASTLRQSNFAVSSSPSFNLLAALQIMTATPSRILQHGDLDQCELSLQSTLEEQAEHPAYLGYLTGRTTSRASTREVKMRAPIEQAGYEGMAQLSDFVCADSSAFRLK